MINDAVLLLVGAVVLLVDDDQAEAADRGKDRRPRPDHDGDVAAANPVPLIVALAIGQPAVLDRDAVAEGRVEGCRDGGRRSCA